MKILVTGSKGQLAQVFIRRLEEQGHECLARDLDTLDIGDRAAVMKEAAATGPGLIVNCAAYNLVDEAERFPEAVFRTNAAGPENLALAALETGALLVHFGSDYIFDGAKAPAPYGENDAANPLNKYGASKLEGEKRIRQTGARHLILRVSWLYGKGDRHFIGKLLDWSKRPGELRIANDEISAPTWTEDVATGTLAALKAGLSGTWHLPNTGCCSRYEWAGLVFKTLGIKKNIIRGSMADFRSPAKRPGFSAMTNAAISRELGLTVPRWDDAVIKFLKTNGGLMTG